MRHPLAIYRERRGLTLAQLGKLLGAGRGTVFKWENGQGPRPARAIEIEHATKGEFPRWTLRPDLWSPPQGAAE